MLRLAERETHGMVQAEPLGFKVWLNDPTYPNIFFHNGHSYAKLKPEDLRVFPNLFEVLYGKIHFDGIPAHARPILSELMATNEHKDYASAAISKIPAQVLSEVKPEAAELGAWGVFESKALKEASAQMSYGTIEEYITKVVPIFTNINGQNVVLAQLRANRPGGNITQSNGLQPLVFQSINYGEPGNPQALRDMLFYLIDSGKLSYDRRRLDDLLSDKAELAARGIGDLVNGAAIILSLDSEENNTKYPYVLDNPFSQTGFVRDLSPLSLAGVKAISLRNRFSSLATLVDPDLYPILANNQINIPKTSPELNSKPILAEGVCIVTYSTGFETDYKDMTPEKIAALYTSMQLAIKRVMQQPGYENASYMIGENAGAGAGQTLIEKHLQGYVSRFVNVHPNVKQVKPTKENVLYQNDSVYIIAHPLSFGQVIVQFKQDKDFLDRTEKELIDFADARIYNFHSLNKLGITSDRNVYMLGNDFTVRPVPEQEKLWKPKAGFFERGSGIRVVTSSDISPIELAANIPGKQEQFIRDYQKA